MSLGAKLADRYHASRVVVEVPELAAVIPEGRIYGHPYTLADDDALREIYSDDDNNGWAEIVIRRALDKDDQRLFNRGDKANLMNHVEAAIVKRIAQELIASIAIEDARKNSEPTPISTVG